MNHRDELKQIRQMEKATKQKNKAAQRERAKKQPSSLKAFLKKNKAIAVLIIVAIIAAVGFGVYKIADRIRFNNLPRIEKAAELLEEGLTDVGESYLKQVSSNGAIVFLYDVSNNSRAYAYYESASSDFCHLRFGKPTDSFGCDCEIFYNQRWDVPCSSFTKIKTKNGTDAVVLISPPITQRDLNSGDTISYGRSIWYDIVPEDTLGNEFETFFLNNNWQYIENTARYPAWMVILDMDTLPDDYELHYGDFVLTAEDIRSGTWSPPANES